MHGPINIRSLFIQLSSWCTVPETYSLPLLNYQDDARSNKPKVSLYSTIKMMHGPINIWFSWSTPLPLWCRCDLDSPFLSWVLCHKHGHSIFICTTEEQRAVIHFCRLKVYQVPKCMEWCQCSMGTVSCCEGLSVNWSRGSKMVAQALSMGYELDANPHPLLMQTRNEQDPAEQTGDCWWSGTSNCK